MEIDNLGDVLKKRREEIKLTLREVEERTGVSNAYLSQLENQKIRKPSPKVLKKLADTYGLSYAYLMNLAGYPVATVQDSKRIFFRTSHGLKDITKEEEKELLDYLRFIRMRRTK